MGNIQYERNKGVQLAWKREKELVKQGRGTRDWNLQQQKEILKQGRVKGFEGHHIKSVKDYPQYASEPNNIQFLQKTSKNNEHMQAHKGNYHNETNQKYNPSTGKFRGVKEGVPGTPKSKELSKQIIERPGFKKYAETNANHKSNTQSQRQ